MARVALRTVALALCVVSVGWSVEPVVDIAKEVAWKDRHTTKIDTADMLTLAERGKAKAEIVVAARPLPMVKYAAEELKRFLDQSTGADFKIVTKRTKGMAAILLGGRPEARPGGKIDVRAFPLDAYRIRRVGDAVFIAGSEATGASGAKAAGRATLYGVYDFLERFVGARFYFPGDVGTVVPKKPTLRVPRMDIFEAPDYWSRRKSSPHRGTWFADWRNGKIPKSTGMRNVGKTPRRTPWGMMDRSTWVGKVYLPQIYRYRPLVGLVPATHSLARSKLIERFGKSRPDFFALLSNGKRDNDASLPGHRGHLCYSNKDFENEIYKDAVAFLTGQPAKSRGMRGWSNSSFLPGFFNIMPPDGMGETRLCRCPKCQAFHKAGRTSDLVWEFIARIARRLQKNGIRGHVTAMAYGMHAKVPDVDLPDNVLVVCAMYGPWGLRMPGYWEKNLKFIKAWREKLGGKKLIWQWNYARSIYFPRVPSFTPRCTAAYYKKTLPHFYGAYMESEPNYWLFHYMNWYVFHKVTWDVSTDVEALLAEHHRLMFGPAARPMTRFLGRLEEKWLKEGLGRVRKTAEGPVSVPPSEERLWTAIYGDAFLGELRGYLDRADKLAAKAPEHGRRVAFLRKWFLGTMLEAREEYMGRKCDVDDVVMNVLPAPRAAVKVDGRLDEAAWKGAETHYLVTHTPAGADPLVKTSVRGLWTPKDLLLAFECEEPRVRSMLLPDRKPGDKRVWQDASVEVFIRPAATRTPEYPLYQWILNARNILADNRRVAPRKMAWDWESGAETATRIHKGGWTAELRIPLACLGESVKPGTRFVANFCRSRNLSNAKPGENQMYSWSPYVPGGRGFFHVGRFGAIRFVQKKPEPVSIIRNGSFEDLDAKGKPKGWSFARKGASVGACAVVESAYRHGRRSLRVEGRAGDQTGVTYLLRDLKPNTTYRLTYFVKTENVTPKATRNAGAAVDFYAVYGWHKLFPRPRLKGTTPWTRMSFRMTMPAKLKDVPWLRLTLRCATGTVWYDDVRMRPVEKTGR